MNADAGAVTALSLTAVDVYTPLYRTFKLAYEKRRIDLTSTAEKPQLKLLHENADTRILSLNNELDPAENEITLKISYQITMPNQPPQLYNLQLYRTYIESKNSIAARDNEKEKLIAEMRLEASERALNQIHTLSSSPAPRIQTTNTP